MKPTLTRSDDDILKIFRALKSKQDVADLLEVDYSTIIYLLYRPDKPVPYTKFYIKKKSGGQREILAPISNLKILQKKLAYILYLAYKPKSSVYGFCKDKDILDNARLHARKNLVFNIDLENFFPSIHVGRIIGLFQSTAFSFPREVAILLAQICCYEGKLPQGAPTSPVISNLICYTLDNDLQKLAKETNCLYTRYADDITFSTNSRELNLDIVSRSHGIITCGQKLTSIIQKNNFSINQSKVRLQRHYMRQEVTGLTVNEFSNVSRKYIRELRTILYAWERFGKVNASNVYFRLHPSRQDEPDLTPVLYGKISFLKFIRSGKDPIYRKFKNRLNRLIDPHSVDLPVSAIDELKRAIWVIKTSVGYTGTAFMLRDVGLVTCYHVIDGACGIVEVYNSETKDVYKAEVVKQSSIPDLAVLKILAPTTVTFFSLEKSTIETPQIKEAITVVGFPGYRTNDTPQCYEGKISSKSNGIGILSIERFTIDKPIYKGMSGSPVVDKDNGVLGVAVHGAVDPSRSSTVWDYGITPIQYIDGLS
ncbi:MAG: reverse transcriptase domain-containing protein [Candidatus Paceibacterota bacterium]